jgi:hypothetical protein
MDVPPKFLNNDHKGICAFGFLLVFICNPHQTIDLRVVD